MYQAGLCQRQSLIMVAVDKPFSEITQGGSIVLKHVPPYRILVADIKNVPVDGIYSAP